jgi:hypothetical protein
MSLAWALINGSAGQQLRSARYRYGLISVGRLGEMTGGVSPGPPIQGERPGVTITVRDGLDPPLDDPGVAGRAAATAALIAAIRAGIDRLCSVGSSCANVDAGVVATALLDAERVGVTVALALVVAVGLNGSSRAHALAAKVHDTSNMTTIIPIVDRRIEVTIKPSRVRFSRARARP